MVVTDLLVENFKDIFDYQYTARMEEELDEVEDGAKSWLDALKEFYGKFEDDLSYAQKHMENIKRMEKATDEKCERCGSPLVSSGVSTVRSTPARLTTRKIRTPVRSRKKIRSTCQISTRRKCRRRRKRSIARTADVRWF